MKKTHQPTPESWVRQAIGSLAISGIRVSLEQREEMLAVARGEIDGDALISERAEQYRLNNRAQKALSVQIDNSSD